MAVMKVNTDIITSIMACPIGHCKHIVILQIKTITSVLRPSKTDVIVFIGNVT